MKKFLKFSIAVFALAIVCCMPVAAESVTQGDATRDEKVDICDLIRTKKYVSGKEITLDATIVDFNSNQKADATDLDRIRKMLVDVPSYQLTVPTLPDSVTVNGKSVASNKSVWNLTQGYHGIVSNSNGSSGQYLPLYFGQTGSDFVVEFYAEYTTEITGDASSYQSDLMAGIQFHDGTNGSWIVANNTGYRYNWSGGYKGGLVDPVLMRDDGQRPVKFAVVKKADQVYIYMNGKCVGNEDWSTVSPNIASTSTMAVGLVMISANASDLKISNYMIGTGMDAVNDYLSRYEATPIKENGLFAKSLTVNGSTITTATDKWDLSEVKDGVVMGSYAQGSSQNPVYFAQVGATALMQAKIEYTTTNGSVGGFGFTDGTNVGHIMAENAGVMTVALKDNNFYVYSDNVLVKTVAVSSVVANAADQAVLAMGPSMSASETADVKFSDIKFTTDAEQVEKFIASDFPSSVSVNGKSVSSYVTKWNRFGEAKNVVTITNTKGVNEGKLAPLYFSQVGSDFTAEFTAKYTSEIGSDKADYQSDLMAGFMFHNGTASSSSWIVVSNTGIRYRDWTASHLITGLIDEPVLMRDDGQRPVTFGVTKKGDELLVYINGELKQTLAWSEVAPNISSTENVAVGLTMIADNNATLEISDYTFAAGDKALSTVMAYKTGMDDNGNYNTTLYSMNGYNVSSADPGVFYDEVTGYFYMYVSSWATHEGHSTSVAYMKNNDLIDLVARCYRSKNLNQWELCGELPGGYALEIKSTDWCKGDFWAPEVIRNPQDGKYYMYFNASASATSGSDQISTSSNRYDRLFLGVAVSDSPMGPFNVINAYDGDILVPTINFQVGCNTPYAWSVIDASPFFDDDGTLYLYFNKHTDDNYSHLNGVWGVKMNSMTEPDYSTTACLTLAGYATASNTAGTITSATGTTALSGIEEGGINEGPNMVKHNGTYYLTYSKYGYGNQKYAVMQATSTSPLKNFTKLGSSAGNPLIEGYQFGHTMGTGHMDLVTKGSEVYAVYHKHNSNLAFSSSGERSIIADRLNFVTISGKEVLVANGPSQALNWQGEELSGYANLASTATITVSSGSGKEYLKDGIMPLYSIVSERKMSASTDKLTVTLSWSSPVSVNSLMVYNGSDRAKAFSKISEIYFKFAETPSWAKTKDAYGKIENLVFPDRYIGDSADEYIAFAPAVAEFDSIEVTEITLVFDAVDKIVTDNTTIDLAEIVVLGNKEYDSQNGGVYGGMSTTQNDDYMTIDGALNEEEWSDKSWFTFVATTENGTTVDYKITGFPTDKGVYIASVVEDANLCNNGQVDPDYNSAWELYVYANQADEYKGNSSLDRTRILIDVMGNCWSYNPDIKRAVWTDGTYVNGETTKATLEAFIPWSALDVDTSRGVPEDFGIMPAYMVYEASTGTTARAVADYYSAYDTRTFYQFTKTGYSIFASKVMIDGALYDSSIYNWNLKKAGEGIITGSYAMGSKKAPLFFGKTVTDALVSAKIEYTTDTSGDGTYQNDLMGGFVFDDGENRGYILACYTGLTVIQDDTTWVKYNGLINTPVLMKDDKIPVEMTVVREGDRFHIYFDGALVKTLYVWDVISSADESTEMAMGISMVADATADIKFSNIKMTSDADEIAEFVNAPIRKGVLVGTTLLKSEYDCWDMSKLERGIISGSWNADGTLSSKTKPIYFSTTGANSVMSATFEYTTNIKEGGTYQEDLMGGFVVHDGSNRGFIMANRTGIVVICEGASWKFYHNLVDDPVLMSDDQRPVDMTVVRSEDKFYVYFDGALVKTLDITEVLPNATASSVIAMGVSMAADNPANIRISNMKLSTDENEVAMYVNQGLAKYAYIKGTVAASNYDAWDLTQAANGIIIGSKAMGSKQQPIYFAQPGTTTMASATIEYTTDTTGSGTYQEDLMGGFVFSDGNNLGYIVANRTGIGIIQNTVSGSKWTFKHGLVTNPVLMSSDRRPVNMQVIRQYDKVHVYFDGVKIITLALTEVMPYATAGTPLAMGISMVADNTADIRFSNLCFTTDKEEINLALNTDFVKTVAVNNVKLSSNLAVWDVSKAVDKVVSITNHKETKDGKYQPLYFGKTATNFTVEFTAKYTTEIDPELDVDNYYQPDLMPGFLFHDGTNQDWIVARDKGIVCTGWNFVSYLIEEGVMMKETKVPVTFKIVKDGSTVYIYMNGQLATSGAWSTFCPNIASDTPMAIGLMMQVDYNADLEISNYSLTVND